METLLLFALSVCWGRACVVRFKGHQWKDNRRVIRGLTLSSGMILIFNSIKQFFVVLFYLCLNPFSYFDHPKKMYG